jgi:hypothetical protein
MLEWGWFAPAHIWPGEAGLRRWQVARAEKDCAFRFFHFYLEARKRPYSHGVGSQRMADRCLNDSVKFVALPICSQR